MWDSNAPLQLLKSMPSKLGKEHLEKLQMLLDADKYKNSLISGFELCGMYAPFCRGCKKTSIYPCAVAYVNMLKEQGMRIDIDAKPIGDEIEQPSEINLSQPLVQPTTAPEASVAEEAVITSTSSGEPQTVAVEAVDEQNIAQTNEEKTELSKEESQESVVIDKPKPLKNKIRIAVARKKL